MNPFPSHYSSSNAPYASQGDRNSTRGHLAHGATPSTTYYGPALTGDLEYPYYQTLLRFEQELESNYLASSVVYPSEYDHAPVPAPPVLEVPHSRPTAAAYHVDISEATGSSHPYVPQYAYDPYGQYYTTPVHVSHVEQPYYAVHAGERYVEEPAHPTFAASGGTTFSYAGPSFGSVSSSQPAPAVVRPPVEVASYDPPVAPRPG
ncbi:hypothetical protein C8Q78DRAFT_349109 [Trametes maxima]|nr:hypothetical protein C8Q78DRAFT_349109 [Trametes maxima]